MGEPSATVGASPRSARLARLFASPASVLVILPALVIAVGVVVLLLGRRATRESTETMARHQLAAQAQEVQADVEFALDQAAPVFASLRVLAEPALPTQDAVGRMRDVVLARPGIANASIVFPAGVMWGTYIDRKTGELCVHETRVGDAARTNYRVREGRVEVIDTQPSSYDPRTRPQYTSAVTARHRVWMPPRTFESSGKTGLTVTEPVLEKDGTLTAVLILDFDVGELSKFIGRAPLAGARTVMFAADGTVLAYPFAKIPEVARTEKRLLRYEDFHEPVLDALFTALGPAVATQRFLRIEAADGAYLASVTPVGGKRGGTDAPLEWYLASMVPERTLLGASGKFGRDAIIASGAALAIALGVALMFAWNLVRMRRAVGVARAEAQSAQERAKQLGSYRLVEKLGAGGMGEVWRAEHQLLARQAAIKLVHPEALDEPRVAALILERFRREAQTLASLRSRHTIELYDYGVTDDGAFFFVMELLDGLDLAELVRVHGPQPAARVIPIIAQACQSLAEAHEAGLLHRDVKPANLYLCRAADEVDIIKVLDFGIVHSVAEPLEEVGAAAATSAPLPSTGRIPVTGNGERLTAIGAVIGTPGYIPPEQAIGEPLDARGDLYALGCVAWYLLTGAEVYPADDGDAVLMRHIREPVPDLRSRVSGWLPYDLEQLVLACLAKQPAARPASARALALELFAMDIPREYAWTRDQATAWWASLAPHGAAGPDVPTVGGPRGIAKAAATVVLGAAPAVTPSPDAPPTVAAGRVLVPARPTSSIPSLVARPSAPPVVEARTVESRPKSRS